jgi:DNA-binding response OmpR family regulator
MTDLNNKKKILVIDDENSLTSVLVDKLNFSGFEASGASDGEEGLKIAISLHPDLILLDLLMPNVGGLKMLKWLREDSWGRGAKVIILTALENKDYVAEAMERNVYGFIIKTENSLDQIVEKVKDVFKK